MTATATATATADYAYAVRGRNISRTNTLSLDTLWAAGVHDRTPQYLGYAPERCSWCWLGYGHTVAEHDRQSA
jgi:hypothetical protein